MQLTHLIRHASRVIPVTSNTPNRHMHTTIRVADACDDQGRPIATRITMNTVSAKTRHTYITHLVEFDYPERFVSEQAGHRYASTTAIYTGVSDDYRSRLVRRSLEARPELWEDAL
jgi:integrase